MTLTRADADRTPTRARITLAAAGLLLLALSIQNIWGIDLWWQIRTGEWIVQHRAVPSHDTLSYSVTDHPWIEMRWLYCVLAYFGWQAGGPPLLILAQSAVLLAAFALLIVPRLHVAKTPVGIVLAVLGIATASTRFVVRPELVTFVLMSAYLCVLDRERTRPTRWVWALPLLQVIWTNAHTLFIFGPILTWLFTADALWRRWRGAANADMKRSAIVAALTMAACWVNPYFHEGATFPLLLLSEIHEGSLLGTTILEFRSPFIADTWSWSLRAAALGTLLTAGTFVWNWRKTDPARLLLFAAMVYLACTALRNVGLLGYVLTWAALGNLSDRPLPALRWSRACHVVLTLALLAGVWWVVTNRYYRDSGLSQEFGLDVLAWETPSEATRFILDNNLKPNVFHAMADGAYLTWAAKGKFPVYIDGRLEVYGEPFIREYLYLASGFRDWDGFAAQHDVNVAMLHREHLVRIVEQLRRSRRWVLVHVDWRDMVFVRNIPEHADVIRKHRVDAWRPWQPRGPEPEELPSGWRRAIGAVGWPWHSMGMANSFLLLNSADNAARYLERGVSRFPADEAMRRTLATLRQLRGRDEEARSLLAGLPASPGAQAQQDRVLSSLLESEGRTVEALAAAMRAAQASTGDASSQTRVGQLHMSAGRFNEAASAYRRAVAITPNNAFTWFELAQALEMGGDSDGALSAYRTSVARAPSLFRAQYRLGALLLKRGDRDGAKAAFEAALVASPSFEAARDALESLRATP